MQRKTFLRTCLAAAVLAACPWVQAETYPGKPVRVVIPFPPGGTLDVVGRALAQKLSEQLGQPFVVENKAGASGVIGADAVAKSRPDGYTLLFSASTFTTSPMVLRSAPYSVVRDFAPVALVAKAPLSVAVNKSLPVTDVRSLLTYARANPGRMTFAIGSVASAGHLATEQLKRAGQMSYTVVPYKGTAPAFQDLIGGQIDGFIDPVLGSLQYHRNGMLRVVAVTSSTRLPSLPDVPTVAETIPGFEFYSWYGLWGPANLPAEIKQRLNAEVNKALASSDIRDKFVPQGLQLTPGSVSDFERFQREDMARSLKIVNEGQIRVD